MTDLIFCKNSNVFFSCKRFYALTTRCAVQNTKWTKAMAELLVGVLELVVLALLLTTIFAISVCRLLANLRYRRAKFLKKPSIFVVLTLSPGTHSPRALLHARALNCQPTLCERSIYIARGPLPNSFPYTHALPNRDESSSLLRRLFSDGIAIYRCLTSISSSQGVISGILLNVPPALPAVFVVSLWQFLHGAPHSILVVDWHNTSWSILRVNGKSEIIVNIARKLENFSARLASMLLGKKRCVHWCVSEAFASYLCGQLGLRNVHVVRDAPSENFRVLNNVAEVHAALRAAEICCEGDVRKEEMHVEETARTRMISGKCESAVFKERSEYVPVVVSSTSWTADEDFGELYSALEALDRRLFEAGLEDARNTEMTGAEDEEERYCYNLVVFITGRGPLRGAFEERVGRANWKNIRIRFGWFPSSLDYARLLGASCVGLCLHASSSGLDLPMKAVDMLGAGLPVVALRYDCIEELVRHGENGLLVENSRGIADCLWELLFEKDCNIRLEKLRRGAQSMYAAGSMRWPAAWEAQAMPPLARMVGEQGKPREKRNVS